MIDVEVQAEDLIAARRALSDTPVDPSPIIRTDRPFYGVKVGDLRALARRWHREHPDADPREVAALADALWGCGVREIAVVRPGQASG